MTDSIRQQIIEKIDTRFKAILKTGGYKSDLGVHVYDWLKCDLDTTELPGLIYRDVENEIEPYTAGLYNNKIILEIEIKAETGSTTAESLREMVEDVYKAIGSDDLWGGLAIDTQPRSEKIFIEQIDKIIGSAFLIIQIEYEKPKWGY